MGNKGVAFFEAGSWYHRIKLMQEDGTTKYSKKGGFMSAKEAEASYRKYEEEYKRAYRAYQVSSSADFDLKDYLIYWLEEIYSARIENTTRMLASYVLYDLLIPNMNQGIKLRYVNVEYLNALLETASKACESAGNKCRELLNIAIKDAVAQGYLHHNPIPDTKPYRRRKPKIFVLSKERMKFFLEKAQGNQVPMKLWSRLQKGETIEYEGRKYTPDMVIGPPRKGIKLTYCTDTRPVRSLIENARDSDLLICEGMYGEKEKQEKAEEKKHMTFLEAAHIAREAGVEEMWLTHYSPSLLHPEDYMKPVRKIFPQAFPGKDRKSCTLEFPED